MTPSENQSAKKERMAETLAEKIDNIPALPGESDRALELINKDDVPLEKLEMIIKRDPSLIGRILQMANTRYYGHEKEVTSLQHAIQLLGLNTLRGIVISHGLENEYSAPEISGFPRDEFWDYSLAVGVCSQIIGEHLDLDTDKQGELFSAGHLHAMGRTILDQYLHRDFVSIVQQVQDTEKTMYDVERDVLDTTHCEIGAAVLNDWNLPDPIVAAARHYYEPKNTDLVTVDVVHFASVLAKTKSYGFSGDEDLAYLNEDCVDELGLTEDEIQEILKNEFPDQYESID